jgi:hypothetical protein
VGGEQRIVETAIDPVCLYCGHHSKWQVALGGGGGGDSRSCADASEGHRSGLKSDQRHVLLLFVYIVIFVRKDV